MRKVLFFFGLLGATLAGLFAVKFVDLNFNAPQIASITIFSLFIYGTLLFGEMRLAFAFGGIALLLGINLLTVEGFTQASNLRVIVFLIGMFLVIGFLEENQFFEHIVEWLVQKVGPRPKALLLVLMIMATISAALVDEVTSILFMSGTMLHLTSKYRLNPVPFIIMLVFATNIGSSASSIGNPIGVMIAFNAGFTFLEFVRWSAPIALVVNVVTYFICRWWFSDSFKAFADAVEAEHQAAVRHEQAIAARAERLVARSAQPALVAAGSGGAVAVGGDLGGADWTEADDEIDSAPPPRPHHAAKPERLWLSWVVFGATILLLVTHGWSEHFLGGLVGLRDGLPEGTMMMGAALFMGAVVLVLQGSRARELVERRVDWWTLSFFMMLFASVGTLEHTGVTGVIARRLIEATGGNETAIVHIVGWATGWLSAFLDNVLAVATFMPVVHDVRLNANGPFTASIYWMMLFGGTFMGNMTLIGSTANIIALGVLEKRGHGTISFWEWFKIGFIVSIASMLVATMLLQLQQHWVPDMAPPTRAVKVSH